MKRKLLIFVVTSTVLLIGYAGWVLLMGNGGNSSLTPTASTDPAEYQGCVTAGGTVNEELAPSSCTFGGKTYHNGDY